MIGVSRQPSIRRTFEDEFVARLKAQGVDAVPSYLLIPEDGQVDENRLHQAIQQANADGVLMTRLVRVERKTEVRPGYWEPTPAVTVGLYPWYSAGWLGYYEPPRVYQYDVYISATTLYDVRRNGLVWSGTVQTTAPGNLNKEIQDYVATVARRSRKQMSWLKRRRSSSRGRDRHRDAKSVVQDLDRRLGGPSTLDVLRILGR